MFLPSFSLSSYPMARRVNAGDRLFVSAWSVRQNFLSVVSAMSTELSNKGGDPALFLRQKVSRPEIKHCCRSESHAVLRSRPT